MTGCEVPARRAKSACDSPWRRLTALISNAGFMSTSYRIVYKNGSPGAGARLRCCRTAVVDVDVLFVGVSVNEFEASLPLARALI